MVRMLSLCLCLLLSPAAMAADGEGSGNGQVTVPPSAGAHEQTAAAEETNGNRGPGVQELSGMSIVGNDEAPKSLYIVPWKSSDIGAQTSLDTMLSEDDGPVDREVFRRRIEFYQVSTGK